MKRLMKTAAAILAVFGLGGFLFAVSGIAPIGASSGHWAVTRVLLEFGKRRAVATHSLFALPVDLDKPWLVVKGAGHYETGCRPCHGSPELPHPRVARAMTPPPPYLPLRVPKWSPEELSYIVDHGIKFAGMPAWPARHREDEVHAMVAFLLEMPEMDAARYDELVHGPVRWPEVEPPLNAMTSGVLPRAVLVSCGRCHGIDGCAREVAAFPRLAGQPRDVLAAALAAYADDRRVSGIMQPVAAGLDARERDALAAYYADRPRCRHELGARDEPGIERGREIARRGVPEDRVPACIACHGTDDGPVHVAAPALAGQFADYLVIQLELFAEEHRGGSEYAHLMDLVAGRMSSEQMRDVAAYYASLAGTEAIGRVEP